MRLATVNDSVFDTMITERDKIVYNLLFQIKNTEGSFIITDDSSYIFAQDSRRAPGWLFLNSAPNEKAKEELISIITGMVKINPLFQINGNNTLVRPILDEVSARLGVSYKEVLPMSVYYCEEASPLESRGKMVRPSEMHRQRLKELISTISLDDDGTLIGADDSEKYITSIVQSNSIYLWENEKIVSIAKVANKSDGFGRINTIFTHPAERDNGYTRMLVGEISASLLSEGITPLIYADSRAVLKSAAYESIGYKKAGEITQFSFARE